MRRPWRPITSARPPIAMICAGSSPISAASARAHRLHDLPLALAVARHLAGLPEGEVPLWVRQMPAFVLAEVGEREAARDLMATILATDTNLSPDEAGLIERSIDSQVVEQR
jgi:hypothetical protein